MIMDHSEASGLLARSAVLQTETEMIGLEEAFGRILGEDIEALENVPSFDRSPYDGYAFKASDTERASEDQPVTLSVTENIRAGQMPELEVARGEAVRLMTGAPVPRGADAICKYEDTEFTESSVTIRKSFRPGDNIVRDYDLVPEAMEECGYEILTRGGFDEAGYGLRLWNKKRKADAGTLGKSRIISDQPSVRLLSGIEKAEGMRHI